MVFGPIPQMLIILKIIIDNLRVLTLNSHSVELKIEPHCGHTEHVKRYTKT